MQRLAPGATEPHPRGRFVYRREPGGGTCVSFEVLPYMHSYSVYDLCLHSDIPFDDLPAGGDSPDITIRQMELDQSELAAGLRNGQRVTGRLYYEPLGSDVLFEIKDGRTISLDPLIPVEPDVLRGWLTGVFMSVLLRQRGHLVLHASAVAREGQAIAFLGQSGWGKSTLAEYFYQRGYELLTDDVLALDVSEARAGVAVLPGHRFIRLREHGGKEFVDSFDSLPRVNPYTSKRVRTVAYGPEGPVPLRKLYVLQHEMAEEQAVKPLAARTALFHLLTHARSKDLLSAPEFQSALLQQCATLIGRVPVALLHRCRGLETLAELKQVIEEDLETEVPVASVGSGACQS